MSEQEPDIAARHGINAYHRLAGNVARLQASINAAGMGDPRDRRIGELRAELDQRAIEYRRLYVLLTRLMTEVELPPEWVLRISETLDRDAK